MYGDVTMVNQTNLKHGRIVLIGGLVCCLFYCFMFAGVARSAAAEGDIVKETLPPITEEAEKIKEKQEAAQQEKRLAPKKSVLDANALPEGVRLPEDSTLLLSVSKIELIGNTLLTTDELLKDIPSVYNTSNEKLEKTDPVFLYDLRSIKNVLEAPGQTHQVSARTIQGFTQYLLSVYQTKGYGGVYIYIPAETFSQEQQLKEGILQIKVIETTISQVKTTYFDVEGNPPEKTYLKPQIVEQWSPVKSGQSINQKKLDDFLNLLNLNPDRYVTATVSKGEAGTLDVGYNIYEVSPWHYFFQIDNAGTKDREWSPRIGFINTNLTGRDDTLTAVIQGPVDHRFSVHRYSAFASYDVPLFSPRLRLNLFGGRSEFDVSGGQGIDFLGNGSVWGTTLTYNLLQHNNWFLDVYSGFSFEQSKVTASLFPEYLGSKVRTDLWNIGAKLHKTDDMSKTTISVERSQRIGGSSQKAYWDIDTTTGARTNSESHFYIWNFNASRYQYLDADKAHRVLGSIRYIRPNTRLIPAKMTTFGGMYTVRGYKESSIVADGGVLASFQYEYDLVKHSRAKLAAKGEPQEKTNKLRKLAPLVFFDYGRADIRYAVDGEKSRQELYSVGTGILLEWGKHLSGGIYYGHPLKETSTTNVSNGRINIFAMLQW
jgi:hemolysin activation/secretion protein